MYSPCSSSWISTWSRAAPGAKRMMLIVKSKARVVGGQQLEANQAGYARLVRLAVVPVAARGPWPTTAGERSPHAVEPDHSGGRRVHQRELAAGGAVLEAPSRQVVLGTVDARSQLARQHVDELLAARWEDGRSSRRVVEADQLLGERRRLESRADELVDERLRQPGQLAGVPVRRRQEQVSVAPVAAVAHDAGSASRRSVPASTSTPRSRSAGSVYSSGWWETPPALGTNSMPTGIFRASTMAS